jgi:hypothetical protein
LSPKNSGATANSRWQRRQEIILTRIGYFEYFIIGLARVNLY